jgi:transcriptional regulator with XRE-family HTH domain
MRKSVHSEPYRVLLDQLIAARKASGITQQKLADKLKSPQSFVAKTERGERRLDVIEFLRLTEAIDADAAQILKSVRAALKRR